jgi:peptidoglycan/xylan/chitin deacetylase (PgdA/CDA1 family)
MNIPFRNFIAYIYSCYLIFSGKLKTIQKKCANGEMILSVYFHNPSKKLFNQCVKWFIDNKYNFISTEELRKIISEKRTFPKSAVVFTVDDGWKENKENIFSITQKYDIPITLFASTQTIETKGQFWWTIIAKSRKDILKNKKVENLKTVPNVVRMQKVNQAVKGLINESDAMTIDELIELSRNRNIYIGSHTVTHPILPMCNNHEAWNEILQSKITLQNWLNRSVNQFAYPNGDFTARECELLKKAGYSIAFTTNPIYIVKSNPIDLFQIPRFGVVDNISFTENLCRMTGIWYERKKYKK